MEDICICESCYPEQPWIQLLEAYRTVRWEGWGHWEGWGECCGNTPKQTGYVQKMPFKNCSLTSSTYLTRLVIWSQLQKWASQHWRTHWYWGLQKPPDPLCFSPSLNDCQQQRRFEEIFKTLTQSVFVSSPEMLMAYAYYVFQFTRWQLKVIHWRKSGNLKL